MQKRIVQIASEGLLVVAVGLMAAGCQGGAPSAKGRMPGPPKPPPAYPQARDVPVDPQLQSAARQELASSLRSTDPNVRAHAVEAIRQSEPAEHRPDILRALRDPDPLVRYAAAMAAGDLKLEEAHPILLEMLDDKDSAVRVVAHYALHRIGDTRASHDLEKTSRDPEARVRGTTAMVLGMLGDASALKILHSMRYDRHPAVRQQAAEAMWRLGDERGRNDLVGWSVSHYPDDEMLGLLGLAAPHNHSIIEHVRAGLVTDWPEVNLVAARAMGMLGSDEGYGVAQLGANSTDPRQRILAAMAFGAIGRSDAQDQLRNLLKDPEPNVQVAAAQAILELKPRAMHVASH